MKPVALLFLCLLGYSTSTTAGIENKNVERTIDLQSQLVKVSYKITIAATKEVTSYEFLVPEELSSKLAFISAKDSLKKKIKLGEPTKLECGTTSYSLQFSDGNPNVIYIETVFSKALQPHPSHIGQSEKQLVRYFGQLYFFSPYKTASQKTTVQLSSRNVESYTQVPIGFWNLLYRRFERKISNN